MAGSSSRSTICPTLTSFARLNGLHKNNETTSFFDCKFYPYTEPRVDPVFAVVGKGEVIVCRPSEKDSESVEPISWWHAEDKNASLNSVAWTYDQQTKAPLLCVTGQNALINILDVSTMKLVRTLIGHGKDINDLAISPCSPWILASASLDCSARIWSLDPAHQDQPCMMICAGEGHREGLLSLAFHSSGKYLLTGGMDNVVNLWYLPDLEYTKKPKLMHYAHFSTSAIHSNVVDCLAFHNDLIISRCANECVVKIWQIEEFDSKKTPPTKPPTTHEFRPARSAWGGSYQILFQLDAPKTTPFWVRFGYFGAVSERPMLCIGSTDSKIYVWDLQSLEEYSEDETEESNRQNNQTKQKFSLSDPIQPLAAHFEMTIPKVTFAARQVAWSVGGEWMVVAGDQGMIALFGR